MARLEIEHLAVSYGPVRVIPDLSLDVADGECVALLGPSGCGKTTTLRSVAGFVRPTSGSIRIDGRNISELPPHKRNIGLVFQEYALFPHMTVADNIAYGLRRRGVAKREIAGRVAEALRMVRLERFAERYPLALSGGQRQRVALARALVIEPDILLLDEPLGALDRKLRDEMQFELKRLQANLGITSIIVTHDQEEALSLASRIALMFDGDIAEIGPPGSLYERPRSARAMDFLGASSVIRAKVERSGGDTGYRVDGGIVLSGPGIDAPAGADVLLALRPEKIALSTGEQPDRNAVRGRINQIVFKGPVADVYVDNPGFSVRAQITITEPGIEQRFAPGSEVWARFPPGSILVYPAKPSPAEGVKQ